MVVCNIWHDGVGSEFCVVNQDGVNRMCLLSETWLTHRKKKSRLETEQIINQTLEI